MKLKVLTLVFVVGTVMVGCGATKQELAVEPVALPAVEESRPVEDLDELTVSREVKICTLELMEQKAHVMDAANACLRIYGLNKVEVHEQRTKVLQ